MGLGRMKYRLRKWYPSLPNRTKNRETFVKEHHYYIDQYSLIIEGEFVGEVSKEEVENHPEFWEKVKEDYEILALKYTGDKENVAKILKDTCNIKSYLKGYARDSWKIYKVRRLSDGKVFTIGDKVKVQGGNPQTIEKFEIADDSLRFRFEDGRGALLKYFRDPNDIKHYKEPLFTTEDDVDIYEGDEYWYVTENNNINHNPKAHKRSGLGVNKHFSTKEKAEAYVRRHKPRFSTEDINKAFNESALNPHSCNAVEIDGQKFFQILNQN